MTRKKREPPNGIFAPKKILWEKNDGFEKLKSFLANTGSIGHFWETRENDDGNLESRITAPLTEVDIDRAMGSHEDLLRELGFKRVEGPTEKKSDAWYRLYSAGGVVGCELHEGNLSKSIYNEASEHVQALACLWSAEQILDDLKKTLSEDELKSVIAFGHAIIVAGLHTGYAAAYKTKTVTGRVKAATHLKRRVNTVTDEQIKEACEKYSTRKDQAKYLGIEVRTLQGRIAARKPVSST